MYEDLPEWVWGEDGWVTDWIPVTAVQPKV